LYEHGGFVDDILVHKGMMIISSSASTPPNQEKDYDHIVLMNNMKAVVEFASDRYAPDCDSGAEGAGHAAEDDGGRRYSTSSTTFHRRRSGGIWGTHRPERSRRAKTVLRSTWPRTKPKRSGTRF